jgi:hypothetical protein
MAAVNMQEYSLQEALNASRDVEIINIETEEIRE